MRRRSRRARACSSGALLAVDELAHLEHGDDRHEAQEDEDAGQKQPDRASESEPVPKAAGEEVPGGGHEVLIEARDDDDVALEPHAEDDADRDEEEQRLVEAQPRKPEELRDDDVEENLPPILQRV